MHWNLPVRPTAVVHWKGTLLLLAVENGLAVFDIEKAEYEHVLYVCDTKTGVRINDGMTDPLGRFWFGSMSENAGAISGSLYCLDLNNKVSKILDKIGICNGLAFTQDGELMYFADSFAEKIFVCELDAANNQIKSRQVFCNSNAAPGVPDGAAIDVMGYLYSCRWDGWGIARFTPSGHLDAFISLPVQRPTRCTFGGGDYRTLYVSSARIGLTEAALQDQPHAGDVLCLDGMVPGGTQNISYGGVLPYFRLNH